MPDASPAELLHATVQNLNGSQVKALISRGDRSRPDFNSWHQAPWSKALRKLDVGDQVNIPAHAIRPGQTQLSFDHAATKMVDMMAQIAQGDIKHLSELFDADDFPVVVGPSGGFALLRDGHHKLAGLLGLSSLIHGVLGTGTGASSHTAPQVARSWKKLAELIPPPDKLQIPVVTAGQESKLSSDAKPSRRLDDFFSLFDDASRYAIPLYLKRPGQTDARHSPEKMSDLIDNPFRRLASELVAKFKWSEDGVPKFKAAEHPLWLKGPNAPDYVEFHVAEVLKQTSIEEGFEYQPGQAIPDKVLSSFRKAMLNAQDAEHPILQQVISFEHHTNWDRLKDSVKLIDHALMDFRPEGQPLEDHEIPVALLRADAPDVLRLHAAARLHDALSSVGANFEEEALTPDITRNTIDRLNGVHDDVGLWLNVHALTAGQLRRNAELTTQLGLNIKPKGKTKVVISGEDTPLNPSWINVPGLPESIPFVLGDLWSDLLAQVEHQPERMPEIADLAQKRLIEAKTQPDHPFYERVAQIPVVVSGDPESIAASLRVGRKTGVLKVGQPVETDPPPYILPPRSRLIVKKL